MSDYLTWLAGHDEAALATLFRRRPEVLHGTPPPDLTAVASRLTQHYGIEAALVRQPRPALEVLSALLMLGGRVPVSQCAAALDDADAGVGAHLRHVRDWLGHLEDDALAWTDTDDVAHAAPLVDAVLPVPADWGRPARILLEGISKDALRPVLDAWGIPRPGTKPATVAALAEAFSDPARLRAQLERLTPRHRELLAQGGDQEWSPRFADQRAYAERMAAQRAGIGAGLLLAPYAYSPFEGEAPAEVLMALRGRRLPFHPLPPAPPTLEVDAGLVDRDSTAALVQLNQASLSVLDQVRDRPVKGLQKGGIGAQEVTRVAKAAKVDSQTVRLVLDAACEARLFEDDEPVLRWGDAAAAWRDLDAGARMTVLLEHWLRTPRAPTQTHDTTARALAVGAPDRRCPLCVDGRLATLDEWVRLDGATADVDLAARVAWSHPLAHTSHREPEPDPWDDGWSSRRAPRAPTPGPPPLLVSDEPPDLGTIADEARLLGLVTRGAATPLLRALLGEDRPALVSLTDSMLPAAAGTATFGSDLTALVVGPPTSELSALLDACADRESRGGAVTWRFSTASVRRALDAGTTAAALTERLSQVAGSGLPQPLEYLLADVGRRHGRLRVASGRAVIRSDDEALLAEVTVDRKLRRLGLRLVAPTVAVSTAGEAETITALRAAGYLPMPEPHETHKAPDPTDPPRPPGRSRDRQVPRALATDNILDLTLRLWSEAQGLTPPAGGPRRLPAPFSTEDPVAAAARLVGRTHAPATVTADPGLVTTIRRANRALSNHEVETLAEAVVHGWPVRIRYRSASSSVTDRVVSDLELSGTHLAGWCHLREDDRVFRLGEVLSVSHP